MCSQHYLRTQHPLKTVWKLIRSRNDQSRYPERWNDFEKFLADIGPRPTPKHILKRVDPSKHYSKTNVEWRAPLKIDGKKYSENRSWNYRQNFGITLDDYEEMLEAQGGVCAICEQPENFIQNTNGRLRNLAVDHCHDSKKIRALLCNRCNRLLGLAKDSPDLLAKCINYIKQHST
jgi:hypothetical protein